MNANGTTKPKRITAAERKRQLATERMTAFLEWSRQQQERDIAQGIIAPIQDEKKD
jgi:hypothetical protein